ncbi:MAG: hypothetical protein RIR33_502 [Pseudomonadota bacterium]|jgi:peptide/nickel transport system permease protein
MKGLQNLRDWPAGAAIGIGLVTTIMVLGCIGVTLVQPDVIDLSIRLQPPSPAHWFGTDELGRDLFARIAAGAAYSVWSALAVVVSTASLGGLIGAISAAAPRWVDAIIMRSMDILLSVPALVLAMALAAALGPGLLNAMVALVIARLPAFVRLARNQSLSLQRQGYVEFARLNGAGLGYTIRRHIAPNVAPPILVQAASDISGVMLAAAALGFIGLGAQPPMPEWGALAASGRLYFLDAWWYAVFPAAAMLAATAGFVLLGDAARDHFDPRRPHNAGARP